MTEVQKVIVAAGEGDQRLDRWLRRQFAHVSQGRIEKLCRKGDIRVDGGRIKPNFRLQEGQEIRIPPFPDAPPTPVAPAMAKTRISDADAQRIRTCVIYRDDHIIALNKPPGLAVQGGSKQVRHVDGMAGALTFGMDEAPAWCTG